MQKQYMRVIAAESVELGPIPFDLYAQGPDGRPVLFCRAGYPVTSTHKKRLKQSTRIFYIGADDESTYLDYAFERIEKIVANPEIRLDDKSKIVHEVGRRTVHRLLENPRSGANVADSRRVVDNYIELVIRSPEAAANLFALSSIDAYTFSHSLNVCTFCLMIGEKMFGTDRELLWELGMGGLLHDIGKTQVDQSVLFKPSTLTDEEMEEVRKHAVFSHEIIEEHKLPHGVQAAGRSHHERTDGSGYPDGLRGSKIHPFARIAAVADVYDAITSDRVYKKQKPHIQALKTIAELESKFDPDSLEALVQIVLRNESLIDKFIATNTVNLRARIEQKDSDQASASGSESPADEEPALI